MSLINDALKRARQAQRENPPPTAPGPQFRPVEAARRTAPARGMIWPGVIVAALAVVGGWLIWWPTGSSSPNKIETSVAGEKPAAAVAPVVPAPKPSPNALVSGLATPELGPSVETRPSPEPIAPVTAPMAKPAPKSPAQTTPRNPVAIVPATPRPREPSRTPAPLPNAPLTPPEPKPLAATPSPNETPPPSQSAAQPGATVVAVTATPPPASAPAAANTQPVATEPPLPKLQGIFYRPDRPAALLNGKTVLIGSMAGEYRVLAINQQSVTVTRAGVTNVLSLAE